jgi:enterochelin esterase family protein
VLELPGYSPPAWMGKANGAEGAVADLLVPVSAVAAEIPVWAWTSPGHHHEDVLPTLVAHDGIELAEYADLLTFLTTLPPMHAVLLGPSHRDEEYSASACWARGLARQVLPRVSAVVGIPDDPRQRVGLGASLGALSMLHAHRLRPELFGGLILQSGSYFTARTDRHERGFPRFARITRFTRAVLSEDHFEFPVPVVMTCGAAEENLVNNRAMAAALVRQGYPVEFVEVRDAHTWIGWRDAWDPAVPRLLERLGWGR